MSHLDRHPGLERDADVEPLSARLLPILAGVTTLSDTGPTLLAALAETLGFDTGVLWALDRDHQDQLAARATWHSDAVDPVRFLNGVRHRLLGRGDELAGRAWAEFRPCEASAPAPGVVGLAAEAAADRLRVGWAFPLTSGTRFLGAIELWAGAAPPADQDLAATLAPLGTELGQLVERWQMEAEQVVLKDRLAFLAEASQALVASLDLEETLDCMARLVVPRLSDWCAVHVVNGDGVAQPLAVAHVDPVRRDMLRALHQNYPGPSRWGADDVIRTGMAAYFDQITDEMLVPMAQDQAHLELVRALDLQALLIVPLIARGRRLGALSLATESGRRLGVTERSLAEELARRAALAVDNARLYREMQEADAALRLQAALLTTQAEAGMEGTLVVSPTGEWTSFNRRFVDMWSIPEEVIASRSDEQALAACMKLVVDPEGFVGRVKELYANPALPSREEISLTDGRVFDRYGAPLRSEDGYLGWAWYFRDITDRKRAEQQLFESGEQFAALARTLQQSLLPPDLPSIPGLELAARYHPAGAGVEVGGDFYDVFRIGRGSWGVVMGDVCGKGAEAASLTALARYTVRAAAMQASSPSRVLAVLNDAMVRQAATSDDLADERFATVVYAALRRARGRVTVTVACGGHSPPLLVRADGPVSALGHPGTLLGLFHTVDLHNTDIELGPGDALVLFTDGVTEAPGPGGQFGETRLAELLAGCAGMTADAMAARVVTSVMAHQSGVARDDLAVLVLRVLPD